MTQPKEPVLDKPNIKVKSSIEVITTDEHAGKAGSYLFDPATGKRTLAPESLTLQENKE